MVMTLVIFSVLLIGSIAFVGRPLLGGRRIGRRDEDRRAAILDREMAFQLLRDIQHDHLTGKVDDEDFAAQKESIEARAVVAMKKFDAFGGGEGGDPLEMLIRRERLRLQKETR